ncbi:MAG: hypothetical protein ACOYLS_03125 [Polymorphobacter sp.]
MAQSVTAPATAPSDAPITVTAPTVSDQQIESRANAYVRGVLPVASYNQYGRWTVAVCPKVTGITDDAAAIVAERVRAVAAAAAIPLAGPRCKPNLNIVFSEDSRRTAAVITRRRPGLIVRLSGTERDVLLKAPLPVRWWHGLEPGDGNGVALGPMSVALSSAGGTSTLPVGPSTVMTNSYNSSLIDTHLVIGMTSATAIVDVPLATGKSLDAVADYIAMVTLAPTRLPPDPPGVPSILGLFSNGDTVVSDWDRAYLSALYRITLNRAALRQRRQLAGLIGDDIKR